MDERRRFVRLMWKAAVKAMAPTPDHKVITEGIMKNIDKHGFSFVTEDRLTKGTTYHFRIDNYGSPLECDGVVIHLHGAETYFIYGIRFSEVGFFQRMVINKFLLARSDTYRHRFMLYALLGGGIVGLAVKFLLGATLVLALISFFVMFFILYLILPF